MHSGISCLFFLLSRLHLKKTTTTIHHHLFLTIDSQPRTASMLNLTYTFRDETAPFCETTPISTEKTISPRYGIGYQISCMHVKYYVGLTQSRTHWLIPFQKNLSDTLCHVFVQPKCPEVGSEWQDIMIRLCSWVSVTILTYKIMCMHFFCELLIPLVVWLWIHKLLPFYHLYWGHLSKR
jgi:hypothetical protein